MSTGGAGCDSDRGCFRPPWTYSSGAGHRSRVVSSDRQLLGRELVARLVTAAKGALVAIYDPGGNANGDELIRLRLRYIANTLPCREFFNRSRRGPRSSLDGAANVKTIPSVCAEHVGWIQQLDAPSD